MFRRIVLDNYLSFDHLEFDLVGRTDAPIDHAVIYGENGSGKTNLISSVGFLKDSMRTLDKDSGMDDLRVLARDSVRIGAEGPMHLLYEFQIGTFRRTYELDFGTDGSLNREALHYRTAKGRQGRYFTVEDSDDGPRISFGKGIFDGEMTRFLRRRVSALWKKHSLLAVMASELSRDPDFVRDNAFIGMEEVIGMIDSVKVCMNGRSDPFDLLSGEISKENAKVLDAYEKALSSFFIRLFADITDVRYERRTSGNRIGYSLYATKKIAGKSVSIPFERESSGTLRLLEMFPALLECSSGGTAFIDGFDSDVHEILVANLMDDVLRSLDGQLVLTTHDTVFLEKVGSRNAYVLRTDPRGYKSIEPIGAIAPVRKSPKNRKRYLDGMFDGIPCMRDPDLSDLAADFRHDSVRSLPLAPALGTERLPRRDLGVALGAAVGPRRLRRHVSERPPEQDERGQDQTDHQDDVQRPREHLPLGRVRV